MKRTRTIKNLILIFLVFFPISAIFSFIMPSAIAGTPVPEPGIYNAWEWHDDIAPDAKIIYDEITTVTNTSNDEIIAQYKIRKILNITEIKNITLDGTSYPPYGNTSAVMGTECYYNCSSMQIVAYNMTEVYRDNETEEEIPIAMFGYNDTYYNTHYIGSYRSPAPLIVPLNNSVLNIDALAQIMNDTYLGPYAEYGYINVFDSIQVYPSLNKTCFENIADGYFMNVSFFGNGTINELDADFLMRMGEVTDPMIRVQTSIRRVFNLDLLSEVSWDFIEGDDLYFGNNARVSYWNGSEEEIYENYGEMKITIEEISETIAPVYASWGFPYYQCFEQVLANVSYWNQTSQMYELKGDPIIMGMANNMNPFNFYVMMEGEDEFPMGPEILHNKSIEFIDDEWSLSVLYNSSYPDWDNRILEILDDAGNPIGLYYHIYNVQENGTHVTLYVEDRGNNQGFLTESLVAGYNRINIFEYDKQEDRPHFFFYPMNTPIEDVEFVMAPFFRQFINDFDNITFFSDGSFVFSNTSTLKEMRGKYNMTSGIFEWMVETDDMGNLQSVSFRKNCTSVSAGYNELMLYPSNVQHDPLGGLEIYFNFTALAAVDIYSAVLPINPAITPFYAEIQSMPIYIDLYSSYNYSVSTDATLTIVYDETLLNGFDEDYLWAYAYNQEEGRWMGAPDGTLILDNATNTITAPMGGLDPHMTMFAIGASKEWDWGVNEGEMFTYLTQGFVRNGSEIMPYNDFTTWNVTSIDYINVSSQIWSQVNVTGMHHDGVTLGMDGLVPNGWPPFPFGQIPHEAPLEMVLGPYTWGIPSIVPLQYGNLNLVPVGNALMSFYATAPELPSFDTMSVSGNNIYLSEAGTSYYLDLTFYSDGTIDEYDLHTRIDTMEIEIQGRQVFDPNPVNETSWGVSEGEVYYYGNPDERIMIEITNTSLISVENMMDLHLSFNDGSVCAFRSVEANISRWDGTSMTWQPLGTKIISYANEYFLFSLNSSLDLSPSPEFFLLPQGTTGASLYAFVEPILELTGSDTVDIMETEHLRLNSTTSEAFFDWSFSTTTGVTQLVVGRVPSYEYPGEYEMFGRYLLEHQATIGTTSFSFTNPFMEGFTTEVELETTGIVDLYYAMISEVPGGVTLGNGTMVFYCDILVTGIQSSDSLDVTIGLPDTFDLSEDFSKLKLWVWDKDTHDWEDMTEELLSALITGSTDSDLILDFMESYEDGVVDLVFAITIEGEETSEDDVVPGFAMTSILLAISLGAIVLYIKKRKQIKLN